MALSTSSKDRRDAAFSAVINGLPASHFGPDGRHRDALDALQRQFNGRIVVPGDTDYDQDRKLSNPVFDFHPMAIIYCTSEVDVGLTLQFVRNQGVPFSLRSGGHCTAGFSGSNGIMIDVKALNDIHIDAEALTATVGCGVEFGTFQQALDHYGLNVPGGECSDVCVGGYVQGGGFGFTAVKYGVSCDNVIAARVMLADGSILVANEAVNPDLLWATCGGTGGNFGVLLSVTYRLHEFRIGFGFAVTWALDTPVNIALAADALMTMQARYMVDRTFGPDMTLQIHIGFQDVDDGDAMAPFLMVRGLYAGDPADGPGLIAPLKGLPGVVADQGWEQVASFYVLNKMLLNRPQGMPPMPPGPDPLEDKSSHYVARDLTLAEWTEMLTYMTTSVPNRAFAYMEVYGGAIREAPPLKNAFIHRDVAFNLVMDVFWKSESERGESEAFLAGWNKMVQPYWNGHIYQNYPSTDEPNYATAFWGEAYPVLQRVKAKYDPHDLFTFAQAVRGDATAQLPGDTPANVAKALQSPPVVTTGLTPFSEM